jgi:predicted RNA methylase
MKAIITTSKKEFTNYVEANNLTDVKQVRILNDVQIDKRTPIIFSEAIYLKGAENVTDYVLNRITVVSDGKITDFASTDAEGVYV